MVWAKLQKYKQKINWERLKIPFLTGMKNLMSSFAILEYFLQCFHYSSSCILSITIKKYIYHSPFH